MIPFECARLGLDAKMLRDDAANPLVSVVMPTYNQAELLRLAIRSVCEQTHTQWELIIIDNYSDDQTDSVVKEFEDQRIRRVLFKNHGVIAASRNYGINISHGEWIAFLDSDDQWYPDKLSCCLKILASEKADMAGHGMDCLRDGEFWRTRAFQHRNNITFDELFWRGNQFMTSSVVVKKSCLEQVRGFSEEPAIITVEDYDLWLRLAQAGCKMLTISDVLGKYLWYSGSMSRKVQIHLNAELELIAKHLEGMPMGIGSKRRRTAMAYYTAARTSQLNGNLADAVHYCRQSLRIYPMILRQYALLGLMVMQKMSPYSAILKRWV